MEATMTSTPACLPRHHANLLQLSAAAVLAAIIGMGATRAQAQPAAPAGHAGPQHAAHHRMAPGMGMGMVFPERMLDAVGASAEQKAKLREIFKAAGDDMRAQHEAGRDLHAQMMALMAAPQVDAAAAEALRQQQLARHDTVTKRALQAMLDAQAVLTPEQRAALAERMAARAKMREHRHERRVPDAAKG
jgi:periplasmic protein CpxP/Spy